MRPQSRDLFKSAGMKLHNRRVWGPVTKKTPWFCWGSDGTYGCMEIREWEIQRARWNHMRQFPCTPAVWLAAGLGLDKSGGGGIGGWGMYWGGRRRVPLQPFPIPSETNAFLYKQQQTQPNTHWCLNFIIILGCSYAITFICITHMDIYLWVSF